MEQEQNPNEHRCDVCGKVFHMEGQLVEHRKTHASGPQGRVLNVSADEPLKAASRNDDAN